MNHTFSRSLLDDRNSSFEIFRGRLSVPGAHSLFKFPDGVLHPGFAGTVAHPLFFTLPRPFDGRLMICQSKPPSKSYLRKKCRIFCSITMPSKGKVIYTRWLEDVKSLSSLLRWAVDSFFHLNALLPPQLAPALSQPIRLSLHPKIS